MKNTCGIFIFDKNDKLLICRPTGIKTKNGWTIPKGSAEPGEAFLDAAIREVKEETGLDVSSYYSNIVFIGYKTYKSKKKRFYGYLLKINKEIKVEELQCQSKIDNEDKFEIDAYEMIDSKDIDRVHITQSELFKEYLDAE